MITIHGVYRSRTSRNIWLCLEMGQEFRHVPAIQAGRLHAPLTPGAPLDTRSPAAHGDGHEMPGAQLADGPRPSSRRANRSAKVMVPHATPPRPARGCGAGPTRHVPKPTTRAAG